MARYHVRQIALDGNNLDAMIAFWAAALGYELDHRQDDYAVLRDPDRTHFDVAVPDEREAVERLAGLGARVLWREDFQTHHWTVLADPDGNEFCVGDFG
jgi:catechol 2,3-dioxygenase-like lactoylglutathione lyase family enzyme